jgi:PhnB protein
MARTVKTRPDGYHTTTASLVVKDAAKAIDFCVRALGAEELFRMPSPSGKGISHAQVKIGDSIVMLAEECPIGKTQSPATLGGTASSLYLYVDDVDAVFKKALKAGGREQLPVTDMYWGDRCGKLVDPSGHEWAVATHKEDLAPEEIGRRAKEFYAAMVPQKA